MKALAALVLLAACDDGRPAPLDDCGGDLRGVWRDDAGHRFDVIGGDDGWEGYPMVDDRPTPPPGITVAPWMIEMPRVHGDLTGTLTRRYERGREVCTMKTPVRLHDCRGERASLDVQLPPPPAFPGCAPAEARAETWSLLRE